MGGDWLLYAHGQAQSRADKEGSQNDKDSATDRSSKSRNSPHRLKRLCVSPPDSRQRLWRHPQRRLGSRGWQVPQGCYRSRSSTSSSLITPRPRKAHHQGAKIERQKHQHPRHPSPTRADHARSPQVGPHGQRLYPDACWSRKMSERSAMILTLICAFLVGAMVIL